MDLNQFSPHQKAVLEQFRNVVKDCTFQDSDDSYLARWLIARDFDLAKSEKMLRNSLEWRRQNQIDSITREYKTPEVFNKYFSAAYVGQDKLLNQVFITRYGEMDVVGLLHSSKKKDVIYHVVNLIEMVFTQPKANPTKYKRTPDTIARASVIFDLNGFTMRHVTNKQWRNIVIQLIQIYEANYPETLQSAFLINAPKFFSIAYAMIKPFLHERTRNKICIFSHDNTEWKEAILAEINPDELPVCYGGTRTDPDGNPNCITMVNMGGIVPKSFYLIRPPVTANKKMLAVSNGCKELLEFEVNKSGNLLKWDFHSEDSDIAFAVYRKQDNELIPIVPWDRVDCHVTNEEGEICCDKTGVYVVEFDNSFSFFRGKRIWYSIAVDQTQ